MAGLPWAESCPLRTGRQLSTAITYKPVEKIGILESIMISKGEINARDR